MSDTIRKQIIAAIVSRLAVITVANGYETDIGGNVEKAKTKFATTDPPLCVVFPGVEEGSKRMGKQLLALYMLL